jgi:translation initiation factor 1
MTRLFAGTEFDIPPRCDLCGQLEQDCRCQPAAKSAATFLPPEKQTAQVRVERRKHRRMVTVVRGLDPTESDLPSLLSQLKSACGAGGSIDDRQIELQGDHVARVGEQLRRIGYRVR